MYHSFPIHSSADGHLGCFHVLAVINSAACVIQIYCYIWFFTPLFISVFYSTVFLQMKITK